MCINSAAVLVYGGSEVGVTDHRFGEEIDGVTQGGFKGVGEGEIVLTEILRFLFELDNEIKVAGRWIVVIASCGSENIELFDAVDLA